MIDSTEKPSRSKVGLFVVRALLGLIVLTASYPVLVTALGIEPAQWIFSVALMFIGLMFDRLTRDG